MDGPESADSARRSTRRHDPTMGDDVQEPGVRTDEHPLGVDRALLLDGLASLHEQGATTAGRRAPGESGSDDNHRNLDPRPKT